MLHNISAKSIVLALLVPVAVQASLIIIFGGRVWDEGLSRDGFDILSMLFSTAIGFTLIAKYCGRYILAVAVAYFFVMVPLLFVVSLQLMATVHGEVL